MRGDLQEKIRENKYKIPNNLKICLKNKAGRNNLGKKTSFRKGKKHKCNRYSVDFNKYSPLRESKVIDLVKDTSRSSNLSLMCSRNGELYFSTHIQNIEIGDVIDNSKGNGYSLGCTNYLSSIPVGCIISCISAKVGSSAIYARSAGTCGQIISKQNNIVQIRLPSGKIVSVVDNCVATIGRISNIEHNLIKLKNAGSSRRMGRHPSVRGVAMNPIDHPHGGGEGKTSGGRPSSTPWGLLTKCKYKRKKKRYNRLIS